MQLLPSVLPPALCGQYCHLSPPPSVHVVAVASVSPSPALPYLWQGAWSAPDVLSLVSMGGSLRSDGDGKATQLPACS